MGLTLENVKFIINNIGDTMTQSKEYLTELDSAIGDADHGINMSKGFQAVEVKLKDRAFEDIGSFLKAVGMTLVSTVGGASGPLYGTAFMKAGAFASGFKEIEAKDFISMIEAALDGIKMRGKAEIGDKTMVDAIEPALKSLKEAEASGMSTVDMLKAAADGARRGAESTIEIPAKKGRASYLGLRSIGHKDPGAASSYLMFNTIYESVKCIKYNEG